MKHLRRFNESKEEEEIVDEYSLVGGDESTYLYLDESTIPNSGRGLFTTIDIQQGDLIAQYKGELISDKEADRRIKTGNDRYFMNDPISGKIFDCERVECFAKYANDAYNTRFRNNSKIALYKRKIYLQAIRNIKAGSEIFTAYGASYWKKHGKGL